MTSLVSPIPQSSTTEDAVVSIDVESNAVVPAAEGSRWSAYLLLAKPRIGLMVLLATGVGYILGSRGIWQPWPLMHASIGILLAVIAASAFNQIYERNTDALMPRTKNRPLPASRLSVWEVCTFATLCGLFSVVYLSLFVNPTTAWLTLATILLYAACYTPLKRHTSFCTVVGAIPGALPPVLGWTAAGAPLDARAFSLFAIMFVWQFPHFLAIAWLYRDQYEQAGLKMLPGNGRSGITGAISSAYAILLIPISLLPVHWGLCGEWYGVVALLSGIAYALMAFLFQLSESRREARRLLWVSLAYLPLVMIALVLDNVRLMG